MVQSNSEIKMKTVNAKIFKSMYKNYESSTSTSDTNRMRAYPNRNYSPIA